MHLLLQGQYYYRFAVLPQDLTGEDKSGADYRNFHRQSITPCYSARELSQIRARAACPQI